MATGGASFDDCADEQELHSWTIANGSLDDRLNNMVFFLLVNTRVQLFSLNNTFYCAFSLAYPIVYNAVT